MVSLYLSVVMEGGTYSLLWCLHVAAVDGWIYIARRCYRAAEEVCHMGSMWNSRSKKALAAAWLLSCQSPSFPFLLCLLSLSHPRAQWWNGKPYAQQGRRHARPS